MVILTLLMAIAVPCVSRARAEGVALACRSNLHEIVAGMSSFAKDHNWWLPCERAGSKGNDDLSQLYPDYCGDIKVFGCPASVYDNPRSPEDIQKKSTAGGELSYEWTGEKRIGQDCYQNFFRVDLRHELALMVYDDDGRGTNIQTDVDAHSPQGGNMSHADGSAEWVESDKWNASVWDGIYAWYDPPVRYSP